MKTKKPNILIIEDDLSIAQLQKDYLELSEIEVKIANDGQIGLKKALDESFDLVIVDIMLPSLDGFEICKAIREKKNIPLIIVSAKKEDHDKIKGLKIGVDDYMIKPFSPSELVARVQAHLKRYDMLTNSNQSQILKSNGIEIDVTIRKIWVLNKEVFFPKKEFDLILLFIQNPNRVWTKEQLFNQIWEFDSFDTDISTVIVHIARIREKLKKAKMSTIPIETVWGTGYRYID